MRIYSRQQLEEMGALVPPNLARLGVDPFGDRDGFTWHWTGAGGTLFDPNPFARLRGIQQFHMGTLDYGDIAYNLGFNVDGDLFLLRDPHWIGAHAKSDENLANLHTLGIVFLEDQRGLTPNAVGPMDLAIYLFELRYKHKPSARGHRDWQPFGGTPTACPGDQLEAFLAWLGGLHSS